MGAGSTRDVWLVRHGETEWARTGRHTSVTEVALTEVGEADARSLRDALGRQRVVAVFTSPRRRARATAALAGFPDAVVDDDLAEWAYGTYEGLTSAAIHARDPGWTIWERGAPGGESPAAVVERLDRLIARLRGVRGPVLCFGHGHAFRVMGVRWIGQPVRLGASLTLDPGGTCILGTDRGVPQLTAWNIPPSG
jgi:broad specificity phosphatase PhoE